jgi:hypothetical protein
MQFGGIIYLHDLSQTRFGSRGDVMTPMKLSNPENCKIAPRVILATVDGNSSMAKLREKQLMDTTWRNVQTQRFTNTKDSAWSIVDTILDTYPTKLCYIQDELDRICDSLLKRSPKRIVGIHKLLGFLVGTSRNVSP